MKKRDKIGSYFSRLTGGSRIWSRFFSGESVSADTKHGVVLREDEMFASSFLGSIYSKTASLASGFRRVCALYASQSRIISVVSSFFRGLLDTSVGSFGVFLFFTGLYSLAAFFVNTYAGNDVSLYRMLCSALISLVGLLLMPMRRSLLGGIRQSLFLSFITEEMLAVSPFALDTEKNGKKRIAWAVIFGTVLGMLGFFVSPVYLLGILLGIAGVAAVIYSPEGGLCISAFLLPIASPTLVGGIAVLSGISYLFKLLVGKRNFYLTTADIFVFLFTLAIGLAGVVTPFKDENSGIFIITVAIVYILCVNLVRSGKQLSQLLSALNSGALILGLCCIFAALFPGELGNVGSYICEKSNFLYLLPLLLPASLCTALNRGAFSSGVITCCVILTAAALTFSESMYLAVILTATLFFLGAFRKRLTVICISLISCIGIMTLFATGIIKGDMLYLSTDAGAVHTAFKYFVSGAGFGEKAFEFAFRSAGFSGGSADIFTAVIIAGGAAVLLLFAVMLVFLLRRGIRFLSAKREKSFSYPAGASLAILCALILCGVFSGEWASFRNIILFSMACGCISSLPRIYEREVGNEYEIE